MGLLNWVRGRFGRTNNEVEEEAAEAEELEDEERRLENLTEDEIRAETNKRQYLSELAKDQATELELLGQIDEISKAKYRITKGRVQAWSDNATRLQNARLKYGGVLSTGTKKIRTWLRVSTEELRLKGTIVSVPNLQQQIELWRKEQQEQLRIMELQTKQAILNNNADLKLFQRMRGQVVEQQDAAKEYNKFLARQLAIFNKILRVIVREIQDEEREIKVEIAASNGRALLHKERREGLATGTGSR